MDFNKRISSSGSALKIKMFLQFRKVAILEKGSQKWPEMASLNRRMFPRNLQQDPLNGPLKNTWVSNSSNNFLRDLLVRSHSIFDKILVGSNGWPLIQGAPFGPCRSISALALFAEAVRHPPRYWWDVETGEKAWQNARRSMIICMYTDRYIYIYM